jgi:Uncharacterized protein conserved in bacteria (DUF2330)
VLRRGHRLEPLEERALEAVVEYQIVILGAGDSLGLDTWLRREGYRIPEGAEPYLRPYVASGMKFFVAKVDPAKVRFTAGRASLSPLRFQYDAETFSLPIRLGLLSSPGTQDLVVHILARDRRFEVSNRPNVTIPTNLDVDASVKDRFSAFYAALFDRTLAQAPSSPSTRGVRASAIPARAGSRGSRRRIWRSSARNSSPRCAPKRPRRRRAAGPSTCARGSRRRTSC